MCDNFRQSEIGGIYIEVSFNDLEIRGDSAKEFESVFVCQVP